MRACKRLLLAELRNRQYVFLLTIGAIILLHSVVISLIIQSVDIDLIRWIDIGLISIAFFIPFLRTFTIWQDEWKRKSIQRLLTLPTSRIYLVIVKYVVIFLEVLTILILTILAMWIQWHVSNGLLFRVEPILAMEWMSIGQILNILLSITSLIFICFMSYLFGRSINRFYLQITFITVFLSLLVSITIYSIVPHFLTILVFVLTYFSFSYCLLDNKMSVE
ncbi:hypothetical protein [Bacillus carboniphilus]|uniref:hypothetical protein n=1 Tax=Bacillus carboniphilus TaxID=86663 RepID=UPI0031DE2A64